jgi:uncharacterized protein YdaU (DUF1376 family)
MRKPKPKELFSMPFMVDRYLQKTENLSLEQHGAYCLLLFAMWKEKGSVPDDDDVLARKLRVGVRQWIKLKDVLRPFLIFYGPEGERRITQGTLQEQMNYTVENRAIASSVASKAATVRWERDRALKALSASSNAQSNAPSIPPSTPSSNASRYAPVMLSKERDISSTFLPLTAREEGDGGEGSEVVQTVTTPKSAAVRTLERLEAKGSWRGAHPKPNSKRNGAA